MKKILGLDLGVASIGWALVNEAENKNEESSIIKLGVRVNPLTVDENKNFEKGKSITTNAERTMKRTARRNLQRYKLRRANLIDCLKQNNIINDESKLYESGNNTTFETYRLRAKAASEEVSLEAMARILLMINKKRGYRSSRKANSADEGQIVDGMALAKRMYDEGITPGQVLQSLFREKKRYTPAFYRSDLENELNLVWKCQQKFYPEILTDELKEKIKGKSSEQTFAIFPTLHKLSPSDRKEKDKRLAALDRRVEGLTHQLPIEDVVSVICDINGAVNNSSSYLGAISDRSKELYFNHQTVGQYLIEQLNNNPNYSFKKKVFYRTDYLNEFEQIWTVQSKFHPELTDELKREIRDIIIFYQRPLKSQKGLISLCELESKTIEVMCDGKLCKRTIGPKVCPKSSPLFQEFRIWQEINNLEIEDKDTGATHDIEPKDKKRLFDELQYKEKMSKTEILKVLFGKAKNYNLNYESLDGNKTMAKIYSAYQKIIVITGHEEYNFAKLPSEDIRNTVKKIFSGLGLSTDYLDCNSELTGKDYENQPFYRLWHLLYSYEGDKSSTGIEGLKRKISEMFGCDLECAAVIANITFEPDYGSLSARALHKILPFMREGNKYIQACSNVGFKNSATKEEIENKVLKDHLDLLPRNSLRNPVVEKILNQMINLINEIIDTYGRPDEVRLEMARELKKNAKERQELMAAINRANSENEKYRKILHDEFKIEHVSRNDIIRYKLYLELETNGFKTLYSNTYIQREKLFSREFDIEHIIPQASMFDDSFSNKTLEARDVNIKKGNTTAFDFVQTNYGEEKLEEYRLRVNDLYNKKIISKSKRDKLLMSGKDIPLDFINRDLRDSQYIARKAREILEDIVKYVVTTTGSITDRLRQDWQIVDVMQELNMDKYERIGEVEEWKDRDGRKIRRIKDWTKRNDHRHHAMDALTIAFTKRSIIQYLNNLSARSDKSDSVCLIEKKELHRENNKLCFNMPFKNFRNEAKKHLESIFVSIKAKNKVVTPNTNKTKKRGGYNYKVELTPRGQLHNETIYGSVQRYVTKTVSVGSAMTVQMVAKVADCRCREALFKRLEQFNFDAKKAFTGANSLEKNPIYVDDAHTVQVPSKIKIVSLETFYTIRKAIDKDLKVEKVVDGKIKKILEERLAEYGGDANKAFSNIDENPIYLNKEKGITIKRVTIFGVANAVALHDRKDVSGNVTLDSSNCKQPVDYVSTSNNHHIAIFRDSKGKLQEHVVSFFEAASLAKSCGSVIDYNYNKEEGWQFLFTMKQNEYFVFPNKETGFDPNEIDLTDPENFALISPNLFRVQKLTNGDYTFRHHLETTVGCKDKDKEKKLRDITWKRITSASGLEGAVKVRINHIGQIVHVGEY